MGNRESLEQGHTWDALKVIFGIAVVAIAVGVFYGYRYSPKSAMLAFLASLLGYAIGGVTGFLFGFPRYTENATVAGIEDLRKAITAQEKSPQPSTLRPNTNLERIVDWLMTMIVGATLVNIQGLGTWATSWFKELSMTIKSPDGGQVPTPVSAVPGALLVVPFVIAGFLHLFLWARRYLLREWTVADQSLQDLKEQVSKITSAVFQVNPNTLQRMNSNLSTLGVEESTIADVVNRYRSARTWDDEPLKNFGPSEARGFRLSATVKAESSGQGEPSYQVVVKIDRPDGTAVIGGAVFLLHNTYDEPAIIYQAVNQREVVESFWCSEAFVVGALIVTTKERTEPPSRETTRLALDLAKVPDIPKGFH